MRMKNDDQDQDDYKQTKTGRKSKPRRCKASWSIITKEKTEHKHDTNRNSLHRHQAYNQQ